MKNTMLVFLVITITAYGFTQSNTSPPSSHPKKKALQQKREWLSLHINCCIDHTKMQLPLMYGKMSTLFFSGFNSQIDPPSNDEYDFGDAPDASYPTLIANDGARHLMDGRTFLGNSVDGEADGIPSLAANGDDLSKVYDEDGVRFHNRIIAGQSTEIAVSASAKGFLNAWIDQDMDGSWADSTDHIFINQSLSPGLNLLSITIPADNPGGTSYMRFRFDTIGNLSYTGIATNGEVEDYKITIHPVE